MSEVTIYKGDNLKVLKCFDLNLFDLIYMDVPFNTGNDRQRGDNWFKDRFDDYKWFLVPRMAEAFTHLTKRGSMMVHCDYHEGHYIKTWLDDLVGRDRFMGEIIWTWDYGAKPKNKWAQKHNYIFWYANNPEDYIFNNEEIDRVPYMSKAFIDEAKFKRGKIPTNVWFMTIVPTMSAENTGYPTQKPQKLLDRIVRVHTLPSSRVLDPFAGAGTTAAACLKYDRNCTLIDDNSMAIDTIEHRFPGVIKGEWKESLGVCKPGK